MASSSGSLLIEIGANLARLQGDLGRMQHMVGKSIGQITSAFRTMGISIGSALSVAGIGAFIKDAINLGEQINKASQKFGIGAESLSALKYAAELSDVAFEDLGVGLKKLSTEMVKGNDAFAALKISARDANKQLRPTEDVLLDVAEAFSKYKDGAGKTAIAVALFGRQGANLIPLLNQGKTGIRELTEEARRLGIVIDEKTAKASEQFNDDLKRLKAAASGVAVEIGKAVVPALTAMAEGILAVASAWKKFKEEQAAAGVAIAPIEGIWSVPDLTKIKQTLGGSEDLVGQKGYEGAGTGGKGDLNFDPEAMKKAADEKKKMQEAILKLTADQYAKEGEIVHNALAAEMGYSQDYFDELQRQREQDFKDWKQLQEDILKLDIEHYEREGEIVHNALAAEMGYDMERSTESVLEKDIQAIEDGREALRLYAEAWNYVSTSAQGYMNQIADATLNAFKGMTDALTEFAMTGKMQFRDFANSVIEDLMRIAIQANIVAPLAGFLGVGGTGGILSPIFGGRKAAGGPVYGGVSYMVGERGPEMFVPASSGSIIPNGGGQAQAIRVEIIEPPGQPLTVARQTTRFDAQETVVTLWMDAAARNRFGLRTMLQGG